MKRKPVHFLQDYGFDRNGKTLTSETVECD